MRFLQSEWGQIFSISAKIYIIVHDLESFKSPYLCISKMANKNFLFGVSEIISYIVRAYCVVQNPYFVNQ